MDEPSQQRFNRIGVWSALRMSLIFSFVGAIAFVTAVAILFYVLQSMGVVSSVNATANDLLGTTYQLNVGHVLLGAAALGLLGIILTLLTTLMCAWIYNLAGALTGGYIFRTDRVVSSTKKVKDKHREESPSGLATE